jgi:Zn finger protein HypA/HybF involved in hydrogenase expression
MHELSLAQGLLGQLEELASTHKAQTILVVRVDIGRQSGIVKDSFCFGFDALKKEKPLTQNAVLIIHDTPGTELILAQVEME